MVSSRMKCRYGILFYTVSLPALTLVMKNLLVVTKLSLVATRTSRSHARTFLTVSFDYNMAWCECVYIWHAMTGGVASQHQHSVSGAGWWWRRRRWRQQQRRGWWRHFATQRHRRICGVDATRHGAGRWQDVQQLRGTDRQFLFRV